VLNEHSKAIECQRTHLSKEADNSIISMESNLRQYFEEQSAILVKFYSSLSYDVGARYINY